MPRENPDYLKSRDGDLYTPITPEIIRIVEGLRRDWGSWRMVSEVTGTRKRMLTRMLCKHEKKYKSVSMTVLDRLLTLGRRSETIDDFPWYTVDEMIEEGLWVGEWWLTATGRQWYLDRIEENKRRKEAKEEAKREVLRQREVYLKEMEEFLVKNYGEVR